MNTESEQIYKIKVLKKFDVPNYFSRYKLAVSGKIIFSADSFILKYAAVNNARIKKIDFIKIRNSGIFGEENWIEIQYTEGRNIKNIFIHAKFNIFKSKNVEIITFLKKYI